jgi:hypothetical protein
MGQARLKQSALFRSDVVAEWESEACVNFAVALARATKWLLHVDWWVPSTDPHNNIPFEMCKPLRVYVADNQYGVFDVRGIRQMFSFQLRTIRALAQRNGPGSVRSGYYSEERLAAAPLMHRPEALKIERAAQLIQQNAAFLAAIPKRAQPFIPAYQAAEFAYGRCVPFAEALFATTGLTPVALLADRFTPEFTGTQTGENGYVHSVVLHPDGMAEDSWGKAPLAEIAARFGVTQFRLGREEHQKAVKNLQRNSPDEYRAALEEAKLLIKQFCLPEPAAVRFSEWVDG